MHELEKKMKVINENDERLKSYIAEKRLDAERIKQEKRQRQNSEALMIDHSTQGKDSESQRIKKLETLLKEERNRREFLERQWNESQYDETWGDQW